MAVLLETRTLRDAPNGKEVMQVAGGTRLIVGKTKGAWLEVTLPDQARTPTGWVSAAAVDQTKDTLGPLDKQTFALGCHWQAAIFGVSAHYLAAVATLRTNVTAGSHDAGTVGPYAFTAEEWMLNGTQPQFQLAAPAASVGSWSLQVAVFAVMSRLAQQRFAALMGTQPTATELYFSQLVGSKAAVAALQNRQANIADIIAAIDPASAKGDGIDIANTQARDAKLLGAGTVDATLKAISKALKDALEISKSFVLAAGDQIIEETGAGLLAEGTVSGRINFDSAEIPSTRRDIAKLIAQRFAEAGYGVIQQIAAIANAIAESGLKPDAKSPAPEQSYGLFQLNLKGVGHGHDPAVLVDPEQNIAIMLKYMATLSANALFKSTASLHDAVAIFVRDFERPADSAGAIAKRSAIAQTLLV